LPARHGCRAEQGYPEWLDALIIFLAKGSSAGREGKQIDRELASPS